MRTKDKPAMAALLFNLSLVCAVLAFVGALGRDLYLASTQWLLVGTMLGVWGTYLLLEAQYRLGR